MTARNAARSQGQRAGRLGGIIAAAVVGVAALVGGLMLAERFNDSDAGDQVIGAATAEDPGVVHVHALGVNPADGLLYAASHTGLYRVGEDGTSSRIADRYQDTMAFTVTGPDQFVASGHPDLREGLPSRLGLIRSTDGAETWQSVSLQGEADFHAIAIAGDLMYGADSTSGSVLASVDAGATWQERGAAALATLAVDPADPDHLAGADYEGALLESTDGARTWDTLDAPRITALFWDDGGLIALGADGAVLRAETPAGPWEAVGRLASPGLALTGEAGRLFAATDTGALVRSTDGGRTWTPLTTP
ncbi:MAG: exo-alpha-sialidase [Acidimicrobiia bacterium]|nr:exo-alpha-sialidase [Acidimicrobiia bacterium]